MAASILKLFTVFSTAVLCQTQPWMNVSDSPQTRAIAFSPPPDILLECQMRVLLFNTSMQRLPWCASASQRVFDALRLQECPGSETLLQQQRVIRSSVTQTTSSSYAIYVDSISGNDLFDGSSPSSALLTLEEARSRARALRKTMMMMMTSSERINVELTGTFHLKQPFLLNQVEDSNTTWRGRNSETVISGGVPLSSLSWVPSTLYPAPVLEAALPQGVPYDGYGLFDADSGRRLPCAREPNGEVETQMQPTGWALVRGNPNGTLSPPIPGDFEHVEVADFARNESVFPIWGRDFDPRNPGIGYVWYGQGNGTPSWFEGGRTFWANKTIDAGLRWNATGGANAKTGLVASPFNATGWNPSAKGRRAHVFHNGLWGHWTYYVDKVDTFSETMTFSEGGWQEGRGGGMSTQPFYVEGVMEALDVPTEWYIERERGVLHLFPNSTSPPDLLVVPVLENVMTISNSAEGVTLDGLTFKYTSDGLMEKYLVPAPGDWSVRRAGAVVIDGAANASVINCIWNRTDGSSLVITGSSQNTVVNECDFYKPGGCGIVVVGYAPRSNVDDPEAAIPNNVVISSSIFEGIGVYGKQTSALFTSVAGAVTLSDSVLFSGPRAGVNLNDGAFGNKVIERNVLFDWVRETQDHGNINTWDRQNFVHSDGSQAAGWNRIVNNAIFNGPSPNRDLGNLWPCIDNDDGSRFFWSAQNVCLYGAAKNYLGNDKVWDSNLFVFPDRWAGDSCLTAWGGQNHVYSNNTCITSSDYPQGFDSDVGGDKCIVNYTDPTSAKFLPFVHGNTYHTQTGAFFTGCQAPLYTLESLQAVGQELGSTAVKGYNVADVIGLATELLLLPQ